MRSRTLLPWLGIVALALAGCGSTKNAETNAASTPPTISTSAAGPTTFNVRLAGFGATRANSAGSPNGSGQAVITINPAKRELCWKFSQLTNVTPTVARIYRSFPGASGKSGFLLGKHYTPSGCTMLGLVALELMVTKPEQFYVNVHTAQFPVYGAVKGQL